MEAQEALTGRTSPVQLVEPGPSAQQLRDILAAGASAPDHGRLQPWRFFIIEGDARSRFGALMAQSLRRREPGASDAKLDSEAKKALRAPLIIVVAAVVREVAKVPDIEQVVAVGAAVQNMLVSAHALGLGGFWRTGPFAYDEDTKRAFGLEAKDVIVGILYIGSVGHPGKPRELNVEGVTSRW